MQSIYKDMHKTLICMLAGVGLNDLVQKFLLATY